MQEEGCWERREKKAGSLIVKAESGSRGWGRPDYSPPPGVPGASGCVLVGELASHHDWHNGRWEGRNGKGWCGVGVVRGQRKLKGGSGCGFGQESEVRGRVQAWQGA